MLWFIFQLAKWNEYFMRFSLPLPSLVWLFFLFIHSYRLLKYFWWWEKARKITVVGYLIIFWLGFIIHLSKSFFFECTHSWSTNSQIVDFCRVTLLISKKYHKSFEESVMGVKFIWDGEDLWPFLICLSFFGWHL